MNSTGQISDALISRAGHGASVGAALRDGERFLSRRGVPGGRLDAEILLCHALDCARERLYLDLNRPLQQGARERFFALIDRRGRREPLAYIRKIREFWSLDFFVNPGVLVPRPETELLVEIALGLMDNKAGAVRVLDIGTGSGAIAVALAKERKRAEVWATDCSAEALTTAGANARRHRVGDRVRFLCGDLFKPLKRGRAFDLIVSNPPYVARADVDKLGPEVCRWEPRLALDGGEDGLDFYRRLVPEAHHFLAGRGVLTLEVGEGMAAEVLRLADTSGAYLPGRVCRDYAGRERVVAVQRCP